MADEHKIWKQATDDALIERLILALQRATVATLAGTEQPEAPVALPAPEVATALLNLLASILEPATQCRTPSGMRKVTEAAGRELLVLMRGYKELSRPADDQAVH